jgi:hypothetical protein
MIEDGDKTWKTRWQAGKKKSGERGCQCVTCERDREASKYFQLIKVSVKKMVIEIEHHFIV